MPCFAFRPSLTGRRVSSASGMVTHRASAAAGSAVRPGRPADDPDKHGTSWSVLEHGAAGIPGAGADSIANTVGYGIDQPDLKRAGLAGGDECCNARGATALAITAHGDADAGDGEAAANLNRNIRRANRHRRFSLEWNIELQQRHVGGGAMRLHGLHVEIGMDRNGTYVQQL